MLIDTHAHLTDPRINALDVISNMGKDGLRKIISVGYDIPSSSGSLDLAQKHKNIYAATGVHPSDAHTLCQKDLDWIVKAADDPKTVAIGEIGLDYHYDNLDKQQQKNCLLKQLEIVKQTNLPAIIHLRDAYEDMQSIIKPDTFPSSAVMHCFSGSKETALHYADMGLYISFAGTITFKNAVKYADIIRALPREYLLIETDCPYLAPEPFRGKTNYPAFVSRTALKMAEILGETYEYVAELTAKNALNLFKKMER